MALSMVGGTPYSNTALAEVKAVVVATPCLMFNLLCFNPDAATVTYVQFFDALTANVTVGTTVPTFVLPLPAKTGAPLALNCPRKFSNGVVVACTSTATGAGAPATAAVVWFDYVGG